jgi:hypothetical protein
VPQEKPRAAEPDLAKNPEKIFEPPQPVTQPAPVVEPAPKPPVPPADLPPAPADLTAKPDIKAVLLVWAPVVGAKRPIVEYHIYRRAPGDTEFRFIHPFPVEGRKVDKYVYQESGDDGLGLSIGAVYEYAVAAAWRAESGELVDGPMSPVVSAGPAEFQLYYKGGDNENLASIRVEKYYEGAFRRQTFQVHPRNLAAGVTGAIGEPGYIVLEGDGGTKRRVLVDFSTGYHLVQIDARVTTEKGIPRKHSKIVIENDLGFKREIPQN